MNLSDISRFSEDQARDYFEQIRWPTGPICPHEGCGSSEATKLGYDPKRRKPDSQLRGRRRPHRERLYRCADCGRQYSSLVNTILEDTHLPVRTWLMAFAIMCSSKKGVSALQLQRQLGLGSYRSAWHLAHRIRHAMTKEPLAGLLGSDGGTVEVDETYVGGKPRKGGKKSHRGRGTRKTPVVGLVERDGRARAHVVADVTGRTLKATVRKHVDPNARVMTDEMPSYFGLGNEFAGGHYVVRHSVGEYVRGEAGTNQVESYFALLKRGVIGSFHHVSAKHLDRYCNEFSFRWDLRKVTDSERTIAAIKAGEGKRLMYREPITK
jgi:transposase-like protein